MIFFYKGKGSAATVHESLHCLDAVVLQQVMQTQSVTNVIFGAETCRTHFMDLNLTLHLQCVGLLTALEQGCGQLGELVNGLVRRIEQALQKHAARLGPDKVWLVVVVTACTDAVVESSLLPEIISKTMSKLYSATIIGEPVWWLWCGAHGRAKWMAWPLNHVQARAVMLGSSYRYPWSG